MFNSILSPCQTGYCPAQSTLDQILSQPISDEFNKPKPGSWTIPAAIVLSEAFYFVWHPALLNKISAGLLSCFASWAACFLSNRRVWVVFQKPQELPLSSPSQCSPTIRSWSCTFLFYSVIFLLLCLLLSAIFFILTTWSFSLPSPWSLRQWRLPKELWFDSSAGLSSGVFLSIRANVRLSFSQWIPTKLTSSPICYILWPHAWTW